MSPKKLTRKSKLPTAEEELRKMVLTLAKRVEALEAVALAQMLGVVEIGGDMHRLSCARRDDITNACDCGADPTRKTKETRR